MYNTYEAGHSFTECSCFGCNVLMESYKFTPVEVKSSVAKLGGNYVGSLVYPYGRMLITGKNEKRVQMSVRIYKRAAERVFKAQIQK